MVLRRKIKKNAVSALSEHWIKAICAVFIIVGIWVLFVLAEALISKFFEAGGYIDTIAGSPAFGLLDTVPDLSAMSVAISAVCAVMAYFVFTPVFTGMRKFSFCVASSRRTGVSQLFFYFRNLRLFFRAVLLDLHIWARILLWTALFCIPGAAVIYVDLRYLKVEVLVAAGISQIFTYILLSIGIVLVAMGIFFGLAFSGRYFLAHYLFIENPRAKLMDVLKTSVCYTKGRVGDILAFRFSFIHWFILSILIVPLIFVLPYYMSSSAIYAKYIIEYNRFYEQRRK